jgi:hypothetical protein
MRLPPSVVFSSLVFLGLVVPWTAVALGQAAFGACDPKFGCSGGITFAVILSIVGGIIAALAAALSGALLRVKLIKSSRKALTVAGLAAGASLSLALSTVGSWPSGSGAFELPALLVEWLLLSFVVCSIWLSLSRPLGNLKFLRRAGQ